MFDFRFYIFLKVGVFIPMRTIFLVRGIINNFSVIVFTYEQVFFKLVYYKSYYTISQQHYVILCLRTEILTITNLR